MPFTKGLSGNINGRPQGTPNKTGGHLRQLITQFLENNFEQVKIDFSELEPKDSFRVYTDLLKFSLPTLQSVHYTDDLERELESLSDAQLESLTERILQHNNN